MDAEQMRISGNAQWKQIQQNTFTRWSNEHLKTVNSSIENLETDFADGLRLIALVEVLSQKHIPRYNKNPTFRTQKLENVTIALEFLQGEGIKLVNIDSSDIVDCKLKLILGLVWTLILHYSISMPKWDDEEEHHPSGATPKQRLLGWIQLKLPDMTIKNFTHDWTTGKPVGALVDACAPGLCPDWELWDPEDSVRNASEAMTLADDWLDVRQLIRPEELVDPNVDEQSVMTYLAQYPNAKLKDGAPLRPKTDPNSLPSEPVISFPSEPLISVPSAALADGVRAYGLGLNPIGTIIGTTVKFTVETIAAGNGDVEVEIEAPNGKVEKAYVELNDDMNLTYTISYMPKMEGHHNVIVKYSGIEIPDSPFYVQVDHPVAYIKHPEISFVEPPEIPYVEPPEIPLEDTSNIKISYDDYLDLPIVNDRTYIEGLAEGMSFTFTGRVGNKCKSFSINFGYMNQAEDVAFHINPRFHRKHDYIVRNTRVDRRWGPEELKSKIPFPFIRGTKFKIQVLVTFDSYLVSINNIHFTAYKHRIPYQTVRILRIEGDVEMHKIIRTIAINS